MNGKILVKTPSRQSEVTLFSIVRAVSLSLVTLMVVGQSFGCTAVMVGAAGGTAGTVYVLGKLEDTLNASVPRVHQATIAALKELDLPIMEEKVDKITGQLESEFADGKNVWIGLESIRSSTTQIQIRVGYVGEGDETRSRMILEEIKRQL